MNGELNAELLLVLKHNQQFDNSSGVANKNRQRTGFSGLAVSSQYARGGTQFLMGWYP
jgi:hypothetical protein